MSLERDFEEFDEFFPLLGKLQFQLGHLIEKINYLLSLSIDKPMQISDNVILP